MIKFKTHEKYCQRIPPFYLITSYQNTTDQDSYKEKIEENAEIYIIEILYNLPHNSLHIFT